MSIQTDMEHDEWKAASTKKMISYSLGYSISGGISTNISQILFYFYEVEVGLPVALVGISFIIFAIWNAINDPLVGFFTDKPFRWTKKWGMRFPWIMIGVIPTIIFWMLLYLPSDINPDDPMPVFWYLVIMSCALDGFFSLFATHHAAGYTVHFPTDFERRKSGALNSAIPQMIGLISSFVFPLLYVYGQKNTAVLAIFIIFLVRVVCLIFLIPGIRESDEIKKRFLRGYEEADELSFWKTMGLAFRKKNFLATLILFLLTATGWGLYLASNVYFVKDVLRLPLSVAVYTLLGSFLGFVGSIPIWVKVAKKIGHVKTMKLGLLLVVPALLPSLWITTLGESIFYSFLGGIAFGAHSIMIGPITADVYDEVTVLTGKHQEAKLGGVRTFFNRFSLIIQAMFLTTVHLITQYNPDPLAIQIPLAILGVRIHMALIPPLLYLGAFFIMLLFYDLTDEKSQENKDKLIEMGL